MVVRTGIAMEFSWTQGFEISVHAEEGMAVISANREGLLSLADHLRALADGKELHDHFHLDEFNSLEEGSAELIIEKIPGRKTQEADGKAK